MEPVAPVQPLDDDDVIGTPTAAPAGLQNRYFNRELSWLAFNERVLEEASNVAHPLLERLRFLSISGNNLDEFFMTRVGGLKGHQLQEVDSRSPDGLTPAQQLTAIAERADALMQRQAKVWLALLTELETVNFQVLELDRLHGESTQWLETHFREQIFPVLTPQALDPAHPFPFIPNRGFSLVFDLKRLSDGEPIRELLMVPATLPRFVRIPGAETRYVAIETMIRRSARSGVSIRNPAWPSPMSRSAP